MTDQPLTRGEQFALLLHYRFLLRSSDGRSEWKVTLYQTMEEAEMAAGVLTNLGKMCFIYELRAAGVDSLLADLPLTTVQ